MPAAKSDEGLKRVIGVPALTLSIISGVVGAGIFALPARVSEKLDGFSVFAYIACGILFAAIMLCYAEIGSRVTTSGGSYAYVESAFGNLAGYLINWMYFLGWGVIGSAALMNIIADSLAVLFPIFSKAVPRDIFFFLLTSFMTVINVYGAKQGVGVVKIITIAKMLPLIGIIIFGFRHVSTANLHWEQLPSFENFADATLILFFAFAGFETSLGASGEIKNPKRTVPTSICIAGIVVIVLYILLQTVAQGVLGPKILLYKSAPLAEVARQIIGPAAATILLLCAALSCFGNVMLDILCTPRSLFAGANDGLFPKFLGKTHPRFATPHRAVVIYGLLIFMFSAFGTFQQLAIVGSAIILLVYLAVILATIKFRVKKSNESEKLFRVPGGWTIPLIGIAGIIWLLSGLKLWEILSTLIFILAIGLIYFVSKWIKQKRQAVEPGMKAG